MLGCILSHKRWKSGAVVPMTPKSPDGPIVADLLLGN
jgi:hypothetical protein